MYGLITNNHVINSICIANSDFKFKIMRQNINNEFIIELNKCRFIFTSELIDITFIQFTEALLEKEKLKEEDFLCPSNDDIKINDKIYVIQYPNGKGLNFTQGIINRCYGFDYIHDCLTSGGSSGSPLISDDLKVIGIHKLKRNNIKHENLSINKNDKYNEYEENQTNENLYKKVENDYEVINEIECENFSDNEDYYEIDYEDFSENEDYYEIDYEDFCDNEIENENNENNSRVINRNESLNSSSNSSSKNCIKAATKYNIVDYAIRTLYNNRWLIEIEKSKCFAKDLSEKEIKELNDHGLQNISDEKIYIQNDNQNILSNIFKFSNTTSPVGLYFYRTNHAWYWTKYSTKEFKKIIEKYKITTNNKYIKLIKWSIIKLDKENEDFSDYNNLDNKEKAVIDFLRLTELSYLIDYRHY